MVVLGTRPEAIKLAPVIQELDRREDIDLCVCSTGQHREMVDMTLEQFEIVPEIDLNLMQPDQHPSEFFGRLMLALHPVLEERQPEVVVVQGDTGTVAGAGLAAFMHGIQVAHVEAGLRTGDKWSPFPEEINRRVAGVVADVHFAPTAGARDALLKEGVDEATIFVTGNTGIDALLWMRGREASRHRAVEASSGDFSGGEKLVLVTAHRRESFGKSFENICLALKEIAERCGEVGLVYPVHLNPKVRGPVMEILGGVERIKLIEPVNYGEMVGLMDRAHLILTDSGGIQEEAPTLGTPVLVMRETTERPEAVEAGAARLVGTKRKAIVEAALKLLTDTEAYATMAAPRMVYGDGQAARRIGEVLATGRMESPAFAPPSTIPAATTP